MSPSDKAREDSKQRAFTRSIVMYDVDENRTSRKLSAGHVREAKEQAAQDTWGRLSSFMKGGGCKERFIALDKCIEDAEKSNDDAGDKCLKVAAALLECMEAHYDHYWPMLRLQKSTASFTEEMSAMFSDVCRRERGQGVKNEN